MPTWYFTILKNGLERWITQRKLHLFVKDHFRKKTFNLLNPTDFIYSRRYSLARFLEDRPEWGSLYLLPAATKLGQGNIFTGVCLSTGGVCLSACWDIPPGSRHPPDQTPPGADTPSEQTPPQEADSSIRSTSGRYASYWNAFLLVFVFLSI